MAVAVTNVERFFATVSGVRIDRSDVKRYSDFVNERVRFLLIRAQAAAKANGRDVMEPHDLPITAGLQNAIEEFRKLEDERHLEELLDENLARPPLDLSPSEALHGYLPRVAGGISVALAHAFTVMNPKINNPSTEDWERTFRLFELLL